MVRFCAQEISIVKRTALTGYPNSFVHYVSQVSGMSLDETVVLLTLLRTGTTQQRLACMLHTDKQTINELIHAGVEAPL